MKQIKYVLDEKILKKIPGNPLAYWVNQHFGDLFANKKIGQEAEVITGMTIGDNNKYLRQWFEVKEDNIAIGMDKMDSIDLNKTKWIPYSKGGSRVKWFGGYDYVVNWKEKDNFNRSKTTLKHLYLKEALTWPFISSNYLTVKILPKGFLWDVAGSPCFFETKIEEYYALGFLNTKVSNYILSILNPTINVQAVDIANLPLIHQDDNAIASIVDENIDISKKDWDYEEISWNFQKHPLI